MQHSKVKTARKATRNHLGYFPYMIPIDGCFEDVLQLWPLFFDVNCRLPPVINGCFEDVLLAAVAAVLHRRLPPAK